MPKSPSNWGDRKSLNTWWTRSIDKERSRLSNAPKPGFKGDRLAVREDISNFAPILKSGKKRHAR
jgi:hypothetical protein